MISKGFYEELEKIAESRRIDIQDVLDASEIALIKAVQLEGHKGEISIEFNTEAKKIRIFETFYVVEEIQHEYVDEETGETIVPEHPEGQILLEEAREIRAKVKVGSVIRKEVPFSDIGRKGATRFKQIFIQNLKESGAKRAYEYFKELENEVITAKVIKVLERGVTLDLGLDVQAFMPIEEALDGEAYMTGAEVKVCITKVEETGRGPKVYVSRSQKDIVKRLFELYIPEVSNGTIEIVNIAREPGNRTKIGIKSNNPNVDAKGSCVGIGGMRIRQINNALNGERIDIFEWSDDVVKLIAEALTPARVISVLVDNDNHRSTVIVPDDQFSLAIGKGGQNVRLASLVCGWRIDIKDETAALQEGIKIERNVVQPVM